MMQEPCDTMVDQKEAFESISHSRLLKCLHREKVPTTLIVVIEKLTKTWTTILALITENRIIVSDSVGISKGIFQRYNLFVLLFTFGNESIIVPTAEKNGCILGSSTARNTNVTHNFFADEL